MTPFVLQCASLFHYYPLPFFGYCLPPIGFFARTEGGYVNLVGLIHAGQALEDSWMNAGKITSGRITIHVPMI